MGERAKLLRDMFRSGKTVRIVGVHNGLTARLAERCGFDGVWASGLEISASYGVPDANILTMSQNLEIAAMIEEATALPVVCDCDTGYGNHNNVMFMIKKYESLGIAAVVVEDKRFPKINSFAEALQEMESIAEFTGKIRVAKSVQQSSEFMFIARIEALIAGGSVSEALERAHAYTEAGADAIVIHSKSKKPDEVVEFVQRWNNKAPVVLIPTTYYTLSYEDLKALKIAMAIYANHGIRTIVKAVEETFRQILKDGTTAHLEGKIASIKEVFSLQGMDLLDQADRIFQSAQNGK